MLSTSVSSTLLDLMSRRMTPQLCRNARPRAASMAMLLLVAISTSIASRQHQMKLSAPRTISDKTWRCALLLPPAELAGGVSIQCRPQVPTLQ